MIYLDNAATTHPDPQVISEMAKVLETLPGNPSSLHTLGRAANHYLAECRTTIAKALGTTGTLTFTSGGTESNHWAIHGALHVMRHRGRHIIAAATEHDAIRAPLRALSDIGYEITLLEPEHTGQISVQRLSKALREDTALVSIMLVNNETGAISPIQELAALTHANSPALFHTDAVQGFCKIPFTTESLGVDLLSISAHKLHGPKGIGALWVRNGLKLPPVFHGGGQEGGLRSGTEPLHNIAGFAKAVSLAAARQSETTRYLNALQTHLRDRLHKALPTLHLLPQGAPHIASLSLPGYRSEAIMNLLDKQGFAVSHASACKRGGRSHVLEAMRLPGKIIDGTIRISFAHDTKEQDLDQFITALEMAKTTLFPAL